MCVPFHACGHGRRRLSDSHMKSCMSMGPHAYSDRHVDPTAWRPVAWSWGDRPVSKQVPPRGQFILKTSGSSSLTHIPSAGKPCHFHLQDRPRVCPPVTTSPSRPVSASAALPNSVPARCLSPAPAACAQRLRHTRALPIATPAPVSLTVTARPIRICPTVPSPLCGQPLPGAPPPAAHRLPRDLL